ncbi:hypothetical protein MiSe_52890 [Microseira wollei NIES-4236]|uniref:Uncharacterized protein n=2 Tax=Microseira wollei TaxID=467598 RepID=A0AAV3XJY4_9CYAN|nr:hypothetical protein MiSe_52890 [Microseira wollei NIES-4236]
MAIIGTKYLLTKPMNDQLPQCNLEYTGKILVPACPYLPSQELLESVKLAINLERPLLLMGDPGCGKTKLASAIA